ncbi:MAG TPA: outer membrane beta-barrel protein [Acidobacteriaceae bacterium]|jgi:hypothetical protein|nr:outer membrane beta-barrel protein [Acidobacteriaceae bacterium]
MQFIRSFVVRGCVAIIFILSLSASTRAQNIAPLSGEISANVGFNNVISGIVKDYFNNNSTGINKEYVQFGFSGGVNLSKQVAILGEFNYLPLATAANGYTGSLDAQMYGGAVRYSPISLNKFVPYVIAGGGATRLSVSDSYEGVNASISHTGSYFGFGGGVSIYAGRSWGIRPEYRWNRQNQTYDGVNYTINASTGSVAIFYQWGGRQTKK